MKNLRILFHSLMMALCISIPLTHAATVNESTDKTVKQPVKTTVEESKVKEGGEQVAGQQKQGKEGVNINAANAEELAKELNGIGAKKAQAIIEYREKYGPFTAIEQLQEVQGIGPIFIEKNRDKLTY
ncbi:ComEA family DNA-binding protein [Xenorhabdus griffiniae]|uniref:ComEA family DNA-binding protein n=1 Tax=Xenorhabdus griffiniae TaxID=351672 RepID=A0ABY9XFP2_9GAMM|nr:ComEA family DNA-binding protein [Xenorhabdus griffiniae]MBD1227903.1 ComEA family DNA-binding protein [Xenorhabdus griffiniae]MBE8587293.1 ComEA family DNA-binding protein [Xenorhabdus griffiniae]WMV71752.1 ComEA family DNA-binding protein [Xenorhabdus griffiniae]WNH01429.1 ComEA family DNA-binding protein [Xenorhabdus griffiniae]